MTLPIIMASLAGLALLLALFSLWKSVRIALGAETSVSPAMAGASEGRRALLDEKASLLMNLKDLEFEREMEKLSEEDYQEVDSGLRKRAKEVFRLLDEDLGSFRADAERLIREHVKQHKRPAPYRGEDPQVDGGDESKDDPKVACWSCGTKNDRDADWCKSCASRLTARSCSECQTTNDPDAAFCKKCAHQFPSSSAPDGPEEAEAQKGEAPGKDEEEET